MTLYHRCCGLLLLLSFLIVVTYWMSATTYFGHQFYRKHFVVTLFSVFFTSAMSFYHHHCGLLFFLSFMVVASWMSATIFIFPVPLEVLVWSIRSPLLLKLVISSDHLLSYYMLQVCYCIHFLEWYNSIICFNKT